MPITSQPIATSGIGPTDAQSTVYVTYDQPYLYTSFNNAGNLDAIPGFLWLTGDVKFRQDSQGNARAVNPNKDGSLPEN